MVKTWLQVLVWLAVMAALVFAPAGTLAYPGGWGFIGLFGAGSVAMVLWLSRRSPRLLRERLSSPVQRSQKPWDRIFLSIFMLAFVLWVPLMAWDAARHGFESVPPVLQVAGGLLVLGYMILAGWTFNENAFAAPVVKVQADQKVIDSGPYAAVRHPMYAGAVMMFAGLPLLLGSWLGLDLAPLLIIAIAWRAVQEERTLKDELPGYASYMQKVRYRLIPGIW